MIGVGESSGGLTEGQELVLKSPPTSLPDLFPNTNKSSQGLQATAEDVKLKINTCKTVDFLSG